MIHDEPLIGTFFLIFFYIYILFFMYIVFNVIFMEAMRRYIVKFGYPEDNKGFFVIKDYLKWIINFELFPKKKKKKLDDEEEEE